MFVPNDLENKEILIESLKTHNTIVGAKNQEGWKLLKFPAGKAPAATLVCEKNTESVPIFWQYKSLQKQVDGNCTQRWMGTFISADDKKRGGLIIPVTFFPKGLHNNNSRNKLYVKKIQLKIEIKDENSSSCLKGICSPYDRLIKF